MSSEDFDDDAPRADAAPPETTRPDRDEVYERLLRTTAEFDNFRKRTERERRDWADATTSNLVRDFLPVIDGLERAVAAPLDPGPGADAVLRYRSGVDLIRRQMLDALRRHNIEGFDVVGADFDPQWHEAVASDPAADGQRDGEILTELQRGYKIGQKLLRAAMVRVAKA